MDNEAEWVDKDGLIQRFEGLNRNTLNVWLMEYIGFSPLGS